MRARYEEAAGLRYIEVTSAESAARDAPLVVGLHGRGSSPDDLAMVAPVLDPLPRYIFPQAPIRFSFGGYSWFEPIPAQPPVMAAARERPTAFLDELRERHGVPPARTALVGFSQGAVMALDVGLRAPEPYAALVAMSGYLAEAEDLPPALERARRQPVLIVHGTRDDILGIALARRARRVLEDAGLSPEYREFDLGHEVSGDSLAAVRDFLRHHLT